MYCEKDKYPTAATESDNEIRGRMWGIHIIHFDET